MQDEDRVPDCVLRLPTRRLFLLRGENGWRLSDRPADVFALEANEYFEVELPFVKGGENNWGQAKEDKLLVKPALDILESLSPIPGTVTVRRGNVQDSAYYFADKLGDEIAKESPKWVTHVSVKMVNDVSHTLANDLSDPSWPSYPSPEAASSIAAAVMKNGGRLGCLRCHHPTDSGYGPLADALAAHGVCIQDGDFLYDPPLAEKRRKGRACRRRAIKAAPVKEEAKRAEAKRADEEELKDIKFHHLEGYCSHLARTLAEGAMRDVLGIELEGAEYSILHGGTSDNTWRCVEKAYWLWAAASSNPWPALQLHTSIGSHGADTVKVLEKVVARLTNHNARINQRAEDAGMEPKPPRYLDYAKEVLRITQELVELAAKQPKDPDDAEEAEEEVA